VTADSKLSEVYSDLTRLEELGLVERAADGAVSVPFDAIEIRFPLAARA